MVTEVKPCRNVTVIEGTAWGDCGKGRASFFACQDADVVIRATGGANAGHTIVYNGKKYAFHLIPSGIIKEGVMNVISHGVVADPDKLIDEMDKLKKDGIKVSPDNLMISNRTHIVFPFHQIQDAVNEEMRGDGKIGTTGRGIGPTYSDKADRVSLRMMDLRLPDKDIVDKLKLELIKHNLCFASYNRMLETATFIVQKYVHKWQDELLPYVKNVSKYTDDIVGEPYYKVVIEGAQGFYLDLELGDYPDVTSSYCNTAGTLSGAGIAPIYLKDTIGVAKPYNSRVGEGPFETELSDYIGDLIRETGGERGTTTQRDRRCGWLDLVRFKAASKRLGLTKINLNHLDTIGKVGKILEEQYGVEKGIQLCHAYNYEGEEIDYLPEYDSRYGKSKPEPVFGKYQFSGWKIPDGAKEWSDLPAECRCFVETLENIVQVPIVYLGIGPDNSQTIIRN